MTEAKQSMIATKPMDEEQMQNKLDYHYYYYYLKINWIHSCVRSLIHCFYHQFYRKYCGKWGLMILMAIIISILLKNYNFWKLPNLYGDIESVGTSSINTEYIINQLSKIESKLEKKIESIENNMKSIETMKLNPSPPNTADDNDSKYILDQLSKIESTINEKIVLIKSNVDGDIQLIQQQVDNKIELNTNVFEKKIKELVNDKIASIDNIDSRDELKYDDTIISNSISRLKQKIEDLDNKLQEYKTESINYIDNVDDTNDNKVLISDEIYNRLNVLDEKLKDIQHKSYKCNKCENINKYVPNKDNFGDDEKPDYTVLVSYHTEIMTSSFIQSIQMKLYYLLTKRYDQNAIRPTFRTGDCTPLKYKQSNITNIDDKSNIYQNYQNYIIFKLRDTIHISGITIEHISIKLLPKNMIKSAPNNMTVEFSKDGLHYYPDIDNDNINYLLFDPRDGTEKYYPFNPTTKKYNYLKLNILSNHGANYTCLYRVKIHGYE